MKVKIAGLLMAIAVANTPIAAQDTMTTHAFQLTFIYPVGTGGVKSVENTYCVSINVLGGVTGQTKGFEIGSLFNINKYGARGAQFAGLFNVAGTKNSEINSANAQFAGLFNTTSKGKSVQFAGIFNYGDTTYLQAGGIFNIANESDAQIGGIFNYGKNVYFQAGGIFNVVNQGIAQFAGIYNYGDTVPFQAAGIVNTAQESKCQIAGIVNVAQESKCQIAGIVNVTKKGRFQAGLINVRDTADGVSLGLINIVKKGGIMEAGIEAGEFVHTALTFRSGTQRLYSIVSVGYNYTESSTSRSFALIGRKGFWTVGGGLGTSFHLVGNLGLNLELTYNTCYKVWRDPQYREPLWRHDFFIKFAPMLNYRFAKHFKIYAGPSLNLCVRPDEGILNDFYHNNRVKPEQEIPYSIYHRQYRHSKLDMWIGFTGGIKF